ncbi:putative cation-transporting ATPase 13A3 [Nymphon striatum]|nr:putative cation-transporting ATPase 13A3 [Nymphon striatum]
MGQWGTLLYDECTDGAATQGHHDEEHVTDVHRTYENKELSFGDIFFYNKKYKYVWQEDSEQFVYLRGLVGYSCNELNNMSAGMTTLKVSHIQELHGKNKMEIEVASVWRLLVDEALNPFYLFQLFVIIVWMIEAFYQYCIVLAICSVIAISYSVYEMRKSSITLRDSIHSESTVTVIRDGKEIQISSVDLVPGDVLVVYPNSVMECDAVLLTGSCVVNESMLTGESVPVLKVPLSNESGNKYSSVSHKKSTLYCGTKVLVGKAKNLAIVTETAFSTAKGELVLAIIFPKPVDFQFYSSFMKFMLILIVFGVGAMAYSAYMWHLHQARLGNIIIKVLDILTFVVPPLLSAGMTFSTGFAQKRLLKKGIRCISARYICLTGGLDCFCFDKTGTLTEDDLNLFAVLPVHNSRFTTEVQHVRSQSVKLELFNAMASCHTLTVIDGRITGDSVDLEFFKATNWIISDEEVEETDGIFKVHPKKQKSRYIQVTKIFPFDSKLQRMSVVTVDENGQNIFYMKGSPEIVQTMCAENTVPEDFATNLEAYTNRGLRVIALAYKVLSTGASISKIKHLERDHFETDLTFLGLVALENPLKADTAENIKIIQNAGIRSFMVTGDNIRTAVHVAHECGIIGKNELVLKVEATINNITEYNRTELQVEYVPIADPKNDMFLEDERDEMIDSVSQMKKVVVMDGETFKLIRQNNFELFQRLLMRSTVFARMLPDQKVHLIEELQKLGYHVGMCGDGANDCGALKAAHSGIALSTEEASIASPFTSQNHSISCVPELIREGRSTLVSIFTVFSYQVSTFCFVALFAVLMLFHDASLFTDIQWVICDVLFIAPPLLFGSTEPAKTLYKKRPLRNLLSLVPIISLFSYSVIVLSSYIFVWYYIKAQPWFESGFYDPEQRQRRPDVRSSMLYIIMCFSYVYSMLIFCQGEPHRKPFLSNIYLTLLFIVENIYVLVLLFAPAPIRDYVQFFFIEKFLVKKVLPKYYKLKTPKYKFLKLETELSRKPSWPSPNAKETIEVDQNSTDASKSLAYYNSI